MQTAIPVILALTFPGNALLGVSSGPTGLLETASRWDSLAPIATMFVTGLVNLVVVLPATNKVIKERRGQGMLCVAVTPETMKSADIFPANDSQARWKAVL